MAEDDKPKPDGWLDRDWTEVHKKNAQHDGAKPVQVGAEPTTWQTIPKSGESSKAIEDFIIGKSFLGHAALGGVAPQPQLSADQPTAAAADGFAARSEARAQAGAAPQILTGNGPPDTANLSVHFGAEDDPGEGATAEFATAEFAPISARAKQQLGILQAATGEVLAPQIIAGDTPARRAAVRKITRKLFRRPKDALGTIDWLIEATQTEIERLSGSIPNPDPEPHLNFINFLTQQLKVFEHLRSQVIKAAAAKGTPAETSLQESAAGTVLDWKDTIAKYGRDYGPGIANMTISVGFGLATFAAATAVGLPMIASIPIITAGVAKLKTTPPAKPKPKK